MDVVGSTELVGSYWYKQDDNLFEFTIYGYQTKDFNSNEYEYYEVYDNGGILLGINLTGHFPSYYEVYDLIKTNLEKE